MNYSILIEAFSKSREYKQLLNSIDSEYTFNKFNPIRVEGLTDGSSKTMLATLSKDFLIAAKERLDSGILILVPSDKEAITIRDFLSTLDLPAYRFPARDYNFNNITASHDFEHERLVVLSKLVSDEELPIIIVTTPEAIMQITMPQAEFRKHIINISFDSKIKTEDLSAQLINSGYTKVELVEGCGQFAIRGGIIDIYPPTDLPYRIELFGEEVDRMGTFDPMTQRFVSNSINQIKIFPVKEVLPSKEQKLNIATLIKSHVKKIAKNNSINPMILGDLSKEIASLENDIELNSLDKYLPFIYPNATTIFDYFCGLIVFSDTQKLEDSANITYDFTLQTISDLIENYELPSIKTTDKYLVKINDIYKATTDMPSILLDNFAHSSNNLKILETFNFNSRHISSYSGNIQLLKDDVVGFLASGTNTLILCHTEIEAKNIIDNLQEDKISITNADNASFEFFTAQKSNRTIGVIIGEYYGGYELISPRFALLDFSGTATKAAIVSHRKHIAKQKKNTEKILSYTDMEVGDLVVHAVYGIGRFTGIETLTVAGVTRDYVNIQYEGKDKLFLPVDQLDLVSKYIGGGANTDNVKLSKMGGADWKRSKSRAKAAAREMAHELVELYARRHRTQGFAFSPDDAMTRQFANNFEYEETDGQLNAIEEIRKDMEASYPMDRLLCGDVGYGKTEVAFRAAFKAVMSGKQVAILVPTTILAAQHYQTITSRMRGYPINIEMLSRFKTKAQQDNIIRKLRRGDIDIIIGTHRLLSSDIEFKDLGLVIIDEEQRFGVSQKEKLKQLAVNVDVLTLTATPIPRTLNMAMSGILDMSILEESPGTRFPVQTYVIEHDFNILVEAIRRELRRGGQVFYINNNIERIYTIANEIQKAFPDYNVVAAHGKMDRDELENIWNSLVKEEIDILVSTTIVETGIDLPNANTLIVENADRYGLSQLHQIRGRVGRSSRRAYAYFTYPKNKNLSEIAEKRLMAIKEYATFGAGFKIALRDMEIRGAGNILGAEQHGHLDAIGYDLYIRILNEAILEEKGEPIEVKRECSINLIADAFLPKSYCKTAASRMEMYKKIAHIQNYDDYEDILDELCDRYGDPPPSAMNLVRVSLIRALGSTAHITKIDENQEMIRLFPEKINQQALIELAKIYPQNNLRVSIGEVPFITLRLKKPQKAVQLLIDLLQEYISLTEKDSTTHMR